MPGIVCSRRAERQVDEQTDSRGRQADKQHIQPERRREIQTDNIYGRVDRGNQGYRQNHTLMDRRPQRDTQNRYSTYTRYEYQL